MQSDETWTVAHVEEKLLPSGQKVVATLKEREDGDAIVQKSVIQWYYEGYVCWTTSEKRVSPEQAKYFRLQPELFPAPQTNLDFLECEQQWWKQLNLARTNPRSFIPDLQKKLSGFQGIVIEI